MRTAGNKELNRLGPLSGIDSLAHEIRDPLTTIMASAELLERGVDSGARRRWLLEAILECSERIAVTLNEAQEKESRGTRETELTKENQ